jgi:ankyrin repeat protein
MRYQHSVSIVFLLCGIGLCSLIFDGCKNTPAPAPQAPETEDDVWSLLEKGENERARSFFLGQVDVNARDDRNRTPLHIVAEQEDHVLAAFFTALGADANAVDNQGRTPLSISAEKRDGSTAAVLTGAGADIHYLMPGGQSPALIAVREEGGFLSALLTPASVKTTDAEGRTLLHLAALEGKLPAAVAILSAQAQVNAKDKTGKTPLDLALTRPDSKRHVETAEGLILAGAYSDNPIFTSFAPAARSSNYNIHMADGFSLYHFAAQGGYTGFINFLIDKRADVNIKNAAGAAPLHEAARTGNIPIMGMLLDAGADVNAQDAKGNTAMHIAVPSQVHREALALLLSYRANPNLRDEHGESPLHILITLNRNPDTIGMLLEQGADVSIRNIEGKTPLYTAVQYNRMEAIPLLLRSKADIFAADNAGITPFERALRDRSAAVNALITAETITQKDSAGNTLLHLGVKNGGDLKTIGLILDTRAQVNARNKEGDTSLHIAVRQNEAEAGKLLISRGADIFAPNARGESPIYLTFYSNGGLREWMINPSTLSARDGLGNTILHYAAGWRLDTFIPFIVQRGASPDAANATGETPLFEAVKVDAPSTIKVLIAAGASAAARDTLGNSSLHAAVRWNAQNAAGALIALGCDINTHNSGGKTPLHDAVRLGMVGIETILITGGANLEVRDTEGHTPFAEAVMAGSAVTAERLADLGADPTSRNNRGDTPLHAAVAMGRRDLITLLLNLGASIHAKNIMGRSPFQNALTVSPQIVSTLLTKERILASDDEGRSPLHIAILENAPPGMLQIIISQGARLNAVDSRGFTPLRLGMEKGDWNTVKLLADAGSNVFSAADDGKTPAGIALTRGYDAVRAVFSGRAISQRDPAGNTILHYAAQNSTPDIVILLLELGANKNIKNIAAESPADIARRWNRGDAAALLN